MDVTVSAIAESIWQQDRAGQSGRGRLGATFPRIDTIEAVIVSTLGRFRDNPIDYA